MSAADDTTGSIHGDESEQNGHESGVTGCATLEDFWKSFERHYSQHVCSQIDDEDSDLARQDPIATDLS